MGEVTCECGTVRELDAFDRKIAFTELEERIEALEKKVADLDNFG